MSVAASAVTSSETSTGPAEDVAVRRIRDPRIDATKAIAILLVVLCHAKGVPYWLTVFAYSFHVPLFFMVSGWLASGFASQKNSLTQTVAKQARSLLPPYLVFYLLGYVYWLLTRNIGEKAARWGNHPWWEPITAMFTGVGPDLYVLPPLWFLPVMLVTVLAYTLLRRVMSPPVIVLISLVVAWAWMAWFPSQRSRLFFGLDVLPVSLFFYAIGALLVHLSARLPKSIVGSALAMLVLAFSVAWIAQTNGRIDINMLEFGRNHALFLAGALLGSLMVICAAPLVQHWAWIQWVGRNTLLILCLHMLVFFVLSGVASVAGGFPGGRPGAGWAIFVTIIALLVCVPARWVLIRVAPWALGLPAQPRAKVASPSYS
ncbi:acyltransferase family protein [Xanthomonas campestris]|uniref:acyltransferase family protein n=1 Tax=Xanthomonas campestris TaxID=339 RepID=UPI002B3B31F5|nr:acyltransferase family protein [Xanthomonas campestris pv. campestris]